MTISTYSVPAVAREIFEQLLADERLNLPQAVKDAAPNVTFEGSDLPFLCVPFKFAEGIAAVKGLEAAFAIAIGQERFGKTAHAVVNTDHAALFTFSGFTASVDGLGPSEAASKYMRSCDTFSAQKDRYKRLATNIYRTRDGRYVQTHGSLNALPTQTLMGVPADSQLKQWEDIVPIYAAAVGKRDAAELDRAMNDEYKQAGSVCYTFDEFLALPHGKAIADCPIYELHSSPAPPTPWPAPTANKVLSGIKVLELTRIIAGPAIGRGLAQHGASVLRITTRSQPDFEYLHLDMSQGKACADLDLKTPEGKAAFTELVKQADVLVDGYRPGALGRLGFGEDALRALNPGLVYARENCYGWHGPWAGRSGWQQTADALVGTSRAFGAALGLGEQAVLPLFPTADYGTGQAGMLGVMHALMLRTKGGGFRVDTALAYYNVFVMRLGLLPEEIWQGLRPEAPLQHDWDVSGTERGSQLTAAWQGVAIHRSGAEEEAPGRV